MGASGVRKTPLLVRQLGQRTVDKTRPHMARSARVDDMRHSAACGREFSAQGSASTRLRTMPRWACVLVR